MLARRTLFFAFGTLGVTAGVMFGCGSVDHVAAAGVGGAGGTGVVSNGPGPDTGPGPTTGTNTGGGPATTGPTTTGPTTTGPTTTTTGPTTAVSTGAGGMDPSGIISVSNLSILESETHIAAAPNGYVCISWIAEKQGGQSTNGYTWSTDGGKTFGAIGEVASPGGRVASDPVFAVDQQNNFYMTWIGFFFNNQGQPYDMHVYVSVAAAGTTTWGAPIEVSQGAANDAFDKPWLTVTNKNTVILTYAKTSTGGIYAARSTNQGQTWSNAVIVEDNNFRNLVFPCAPANGNRIWATYHAGGGIGLRWSDDDGVTWPDANKTAVAAQGEQPGFDDPNCVAENNDVWITYELSNDPFNSGSSPKAFAIRLAHSSDGGATIDYRADAHDLNIGKLYLHTQLARESNGALDITYYAGNQDNDAGGNYVRSRSTDGGKTWGGAIDVHQPMLYLSSRTDTHWLGDYEGLWWLNGTLFMSYVDNTQGQYAHVAYATATVP